MWCSKCHYGSPNVKWTLDSNGHFDCPQCKSKNPVVSKSPFERKAVRTLGKVVREKTPKKFEFDQKGGSDSENPSIEQPTEEKK